MSGVGSTAARGRAGIVSSLAGAMLGGALLLSVAGCSVTDEVPVFGPGQSPWAAIDPRWRVEAPPSGAERPLAATLLAGDQALIVGTHGLALRHRDGAWTREATGSDASLTDVIASQGEIFAVGTGGTILRRDVAAWTREPSGTDAALAALAATPDGMIWAAGERSTLLLRGPAGWNQVTLWPPQAPTDLTDLAVVGDTLVVGSSSGQVMGYCGGAWRQIGSFGPSSVTRLAAAPSGDLFAVVGGSVRSYKAGVWRPRWSSADYIAARDSLLLTGWRSWARLSDFSGHELPSSSFDYFQGRIDAVCLGEAGTGLAVSDIGEIAWLRGGTWTSALDERPLVEGVVLQDGTLLTRSGSTLFALDASGWEPVRSLPAGADTISHGFPVSWSGMSRDDFCLAGVEGPLLRWRERWTTYQLAPNSICSQVLIDGSGTVMVSDYTVGVFTLTGEGWRFELPVLPAPYGDVRRWTLQRDGLGRAIALSQEHLRARLDGRWTDPALIEQPNGGWWWGMRCAGEYPHKFALLEEGSWLPWDPAQPGRQTGWLPYDFPPNITRGFRTVAAGTREIVIATPYPSAVLRLRWERPGSGVWELVAGPVADDISVLIVEPDGSLTAIGGNTGRRYHYPSTRSLP